MVPPMQRRAQAHMHDFVFSPAGGSVHAGLLFCNCNGVFTDQVDVSW